MGVVEKILEVVGINVNVVSSSGGTPLYQASSNGHLAIVKVLIKAGIGKHITFTESREHCFGMGGFAADRKERR